MFRNKEIREAQKQREKEIYDSMGSIEKPSFKELVIMMYKQYLIIIPTIIAGMLLIMLLLKGIFKLWGV
ncbi:hypothetical protein [Clostridium sp.]|uniref:hypothetical protein n=1 Tax=Clostridium sp. TaxID=1506 RepID=UPI00261AE09B|nr:hypothetical protein [Clostridium sp.]